MQIIAGKSPSTGEIIYSRSLHDYKSTSDGKGSIDGGQLSYQKYGGNVEPIVIDLPLTYADLFNDWNNGENKLGYISPKEAKKVKIVDKKDYEDRSSFEFRKKSLIWGTNGVDGTLPTTYKQLINLDTDHLIAILKTQSHVTGEYKRVIEAILEERKVKS